MIQILIVDDEKPICDLIQMSLTRAGYHCTCVYDGLAAADILERNVFDLILLDVMLPNADGFELMEYIRPLGIPVIFLTARGSVDDRVRGLRMGAEDYIVKPFEVVELLARVDVVLRRYNKTDAVIEIGGLRIDTRAMQVWRGTEEISLTHKEYDLLLFFARNPGIALPIGISFYTFQILSYVIDLYRGKIALQRNFFYLLMYVSFFPQLIAGPIVRYETVEQEIRERQVTMDDLAQGFRRFVVGLAKKLLLANQVAQVATIVYSGNPANYGSLMYWLAAIAYTLQIYFDFSGYSDMAIGLGRMFGFHFLENFNYPYISLSVTEFWRRWHISLSTWFRDYVYIPLGGNRVSRGKWVRNILVVWGLTGLWHGADWNFLLWGLYYGVLLLIEKLWLGKYLERLPKALRWLLCMIIVCIGWVMFNLTDFVQMRCALARMFSFTHVALSQSLAADVSIVPPLLWMLPALVFSTPVCRRVHLGESCGAEIVRNVVCLALLAVCIVFSVSATFNPFIYFRF